MESKDKEEVKNNEKSSEIEYSDYQKNIMHPEYDDGEVYSNNYKCFKSVKFNPFISYR